LKEPGKALYSCMLKEDGGVIDDLIVYFFAADDYRIVVNAGTADKDVAWLRALADRTGARVELASRADLALVAVQGPNARARLWRALPGSEAATGALTPFNAATFTRDGAEYFIARTGYTGEDGFEIALPATHVEALWTALAAAGVKPCGLGARDTLRLEAGMNLYGQDMDEAVSPLEAGLGWTVDRRTPRDFVGRAALDRAPAGRTLVGLVLEDGGGVLRAHQRVSTPAGDGEITSGTFSPTMQRSIALARVPVGVAPGDRVSVAVRDKMLAARVVKPPFVRNGKVLV
jgi:aminomethyltransferase